ncbi:YdcH family protein [Roseibium sp.]|uniref:YdcH family protein n=1 Tax=Roseibium sp. TaxID=1936156 RepID=UPI003A97CFC7
MYRRLKALRRQHRTLDALIEREAVRPASDAMHLKTLKKIRLRLRDEITWVESIVTQKTERFIPV